MDKNERIELLEKELKIAQKNFQDCSDRNFKEKNELTRKHKMEHDRLMEIRDKKKKEVAELKNRRQILKNKKEKKEHIWSFRNYYKDECEEYEVNGEVGYRYEGKKVPSTKELVKPFADTELTEEEIEFDEEVRSRVIDNFFEGLDPISIAGHTNEAYCAERGCEKLEKWLNENYQEWKCLLKNQLEVEYQKRFFGYVDLIFMVRKKGSLFWYKLVVQVKSGKGKLKSTDHIEAAFFKQYYEEHNTEATILFIDSNIILNTGTDKPAIWGENTEVVEIHWTAQETSAYLKDASNRSRQC